MEIISLISFALAVIIGSALQLIYLVGALIVFLLLIPFVFLDFFAKQISNFIEEFKK